MKTQYNVFCMVSSFFRWPMIVGLWMCLGFEAGVHGQSSTLRIQAKVPQTNELLGSASVAIGGGRIAVGSPKLIRMTPLPATQTGGVHVFDATSGKPLRTILPASGVANERFGASIAISGNILIVGAPDSSRGLDSSVGAVYLYNLSTGALIRKLQPATGTWEAFDNWGSSLAVDGDRVIIGGPANDIGGSNAGAVALHLISSNVTTNIAFGSAAGQSFGISVGISGAIAAVGAPLADGGQGHVRLVDVISQTTLITISDSVRSATGHFGAAVAIGDFNLIVGAPDDDRVATNAGRMNLFNVADPTISILISAANGSLAEDRLGSSVTIGGNQAFWSSPGSDVFGLLNAGLVDNYTTGLLFLPAGVRAQDGFGTQLASSGGLLVATAPNDDNNEDGTATDAGAIWRISHALPTLPYTGANSRQHLQTADSAPGVANALIADFASVSMNGNNPLPCFIGKMSGSGATGSKALGLWENFSSNNNALACRSGVPTTAGSYIFTSFSQPIIQNGNSLYFYGHLPTGMKTLALYTQSGGLTFLLEENKSAFDIPGGVPVVHRFFPGRIAGFGAIYAQPMQLKMGTGSIPVTLASDSALFLYNDVSLREGVSDAPAAIGGRYGQLSSRVATGDGGAVIFSAYSELPNSIQFVESSGVVVAKRGEAAPGGGIFSAFLGETVIGSAPAKSLLRATLVLNPTAGITVNNNEGLWANRGAGLALVARKRVPIPGIGTISRFLDYGIDRLGTVLILAQLTGPGVTTANDLALIRSDNGGVSYSIELREGDYLPGSSGAKIANLLLIDISFSEAIPYSFYGVLASLKVEAGGATAANNLVWLVANTSAGTPLQPSLRLPKIIIQKGEKFLGPTGADSFTSLAFHTVLKDASGACNTGLAHIINQAGRTAAVVTYPNKRKALITRQTN